MKDEEIQNLVNNAAEEAKKNNTNEDMATKIDEKINRDVEMKAIEAILARRILDRLAYPLHEDVAAKVAALRTYHELILNYELANAVAGLVIPSVDEVQKVLE